MCDPIRRILRIDRHIPRPALATARTATTSPAERGIASATTSPAPTPRPTSQRANRFDASSNSAYDSSTPNASTTATVSGAWAAAAVNNSANTTGSTAGAGDHRHQLRAFGRLQDRHVPDRDRGISGQRLQDAAVALGEGDDVGLVEQPGQVLQGHVQFGPAVAGGGCDHQRQRMVRGICGPHVGDLDAELIARCGGPSASTGWDS